WGLQGISEIDPSLRVATRESRLLLFRQERALADLPAPSGDSPAEWALAAADVTQAAFKASPSVRQSGTQRVIEAFFDQMFSRLDPYSRYVPPAEAGADRARRAGRAGLGLSVGARGAQIQVTGVVRDSPGAIAGIRPGDLLAAVDGQRVVGQDPETIAALLAGPENSYVTLCWRDHDGRIRDEQLLRVMVPPETVFARRQSNMLVLRVTSFSGSTASHIAQSVQDAMAEPHPVDGIVIDLRDNRGGLLHQAVTAADTFLPAGLIATTIGRDPDARHIWHSTEGELAENVPVIVLVDGFTASASEIMAAALADRGRAVVVGSATVGKGMVQTIDPMPDGGELFVTWSQLLAPRGWPLQGLGILPQVCTSLGTDALNRQLAALSTGFQPMNDAVWRERKARLPLSASDVLEIRAACPSAAGKPADLEAARTLIENPAAYAAALLPPMEAH
ncbi:MAG TPA: S41 family peptidase, partial [Rhodopila sp.]|nr:S41 family peptidase [Rhodopila sp.]